MSSGRQGESKGTASVEGITLHSSKAKAKRGRLLIVDDEPQIGRTLRLLLDPEHDVVAVTSARDALDRISRGEHFDIILCDLMMPEMTGSDLHEALTRLGDDMASRLVFMTGGVFSQRTQEFLDRIPNERIDKPFDMGALLALIRRHVR
jgi:CheY-like chemotaxis protein